MPFSNTFCVIIKRIRRAEIPLQPQTIKEINVSDSFRFTLSSSNLFLIKDFVVGKNQTLIFTT